MKTRNSYAVAFWLLFLAACAHAGKSFSLAPFTEKVFRNEPVAVDSSTLKGLTDVIDSLANKTIVYVGETHDKFAHHQVQLQILQGLYQRHPKLAIGMEMFQKPFQKALDDYVAGQIDERTFLKRSEYFKRWDMDYNLYKPILDFARAHRLPVVALNLQRELVEKVARNGVGSLTDDEKRWIPRQLDFTDGSYRARLEQAFQAHPNSGQKNFDFFHQAQVLWDETMAESIDQFLKSNPDFRMGILAGSGHLEYGSGIPKRSFRRNQRPYAIVLNDTEVQRNIGDFIVFPEPAEGSRAPTLSVLLDEVNQTVRIRGFRKDSVAEKAGLAKGDIILALDDEPVRGIDDVKIVLLCKKPGDMIRVKVRRLERFSRDTDIEYGMKLAL
jgi:uncharacterized iron-regulated protein